MTLNTTIALKSFSTIVQETKKFYDNVVAVDMTDKRALRYVESMANITEEKNKENIQYLLNIVDKYHDVEGVDSESRINFNHSIKPHVMSYWCSLQNPFDFTPSNEIKVSTTSCDHMDVILWCDDILIVDYHQHGICHTVSFDTEDEVYDNFKLGFGGEPHYILGKVCF